MISLSLHIDKVNSIIALKNNVDPNLTKIITVDNIILFKHPLLFPERLIDVIENNLNESQIQFDSIEISLPEFQYNFRKGSFRCNFLDTISYSSSYDGYDFDKHFATYFLDSAIPRVHLKNHFNAFAKMISFISYFKNPSILIILHMDSKVGFVHQNGDTRTIDITINSDDDKSLVSKPDFKNLSEYIGDEGIFNMLKMKNQKVSKLFTIRLKIVIKKLLTIANDCNFKYRSITIVSNNKYLINSEFLRPKNIDCPIHLLQPNINFAIVCCGLLPSIYDKNIEAIDEDLSKYILVR